MRSSFWAGHSPHNMIVHLMQWRKGKELPVLFLILMKVIWIFLHLGWCWLWASCIFLILYWDMFPVFLFSQNACYWMKLNFVEDLFCSWWDGLVCSVLESNSTVGCLFKLRVFTHYLNLNKQFQVCLTWILCSVYKCWTIPTSLVTCMQCMCTTRVQGLQRPGEGVRSPRTGVTEVVNHQVGAGNQTPVLCKSRKCS